MTTFEPKAVGNAWQCPCFQYGKQLWGDLKPLSGAFNPRIESGVENYRCDYGCNWQRIRRGDPSFWHYIGRPSEPIVSNLDIQARSPR